MDIYYKVPSTSKFEISEKMHIYELPDVVKTSGNNKGLEMNWIKINQAGRTTN